MEIEYKGANCIIVKIKKTLIVVDPKLAPLGLKDQGVGANVQLLTQIDFGVSGGETLILDGPGDYEVQEIAITGVAARVHSDTEEDKKRATMYRLDTGSIAIAILGHTAGPLSEEQLEALGVVDIAVVPIGGNGYTLDAHEAVQLVRQINPKIVIPTHYKDPAIKYEVDQTDETAFIKELGVAVEEMPKLKLKGELASESLSVVVLQRTA